jgi:hypothetical protein
MTERASDKFDDIKSKIEKSINPYITLRIDLPAGVNKENFLELEYNQEFKDAIKEYAKKWLESQKDIETIKIQQ